ncbi:hypothetical protein MBLNU230_g7804t1 [Neophaeotheca triangularis]
MPPTSSTHWNPGNIGSNNKRYDRCYAESYDSGANWDACVASSYYDMDSAVHGLQVCIDLVLTNDNDVVNHIALPAVIPPQGQDQGPVHFVDFGGLMVMLWVRVVPLSRGCFA